MPVPSYDEYVATLSRLTEHEAEEMAEVRKGNPDDRQRALGTTYDVLHATPEELSTLTRRLTELFGEYRRLSRDERPPGARRVQVTVELVPWFQPDADQPE